MNTPFSNLLLSVLLFVVATPASSFANQKNETQFSALVEKIQSAFAPAFAAAGGNLIINTNWDSNVLNGFASRQETKWLIEIHGGVYRHEKITDDGLTALLCHELGHHLGGKPFKTDIPWMSSEGQADYYAASICLRQAWREDDNLAAIQIMSAPQFLTEQCHLAYATESEAALCVRIAMAGFSFVEFNRVEHGYLSESTSVNFETVAPALAGHALIYPRAQCRLDTFFAGALMKDRPTCWFLPSQN